MHARDTRNNIDQKSIQLQISIFHKISTIEEKFWKFKRTSKPRYIRQYVLMTIICNVKPKLLKRPTVPYACKSALPPPSPPLPRK